MYITYNETDFAELSNSYGNPGISLLIGSLLFMKILQLELLYTKSL